MTHSSPTNRFALDRLALDPAGGGDALRRLLRRLDPPNDVADGLAGVVWDSLEPTSAGLAALYALLAVAHATTQPMRVSLVMAPVALATAAVLAYLAWAMRQRRLQLGRVHFAAAAVIGLALGNSLLHLELTLEPDQTTNFMLVAVGAGALVLSPRWFVAALAAMVASWLLLVAAAPASPAWLHFGFGFAVSIVLAVLIQRGRLRTYIRLERARLALLHESLRDPLTRLFNRGHLDAVLARLVAIRRREADAHRPLSVVLLDLDHFGKVNKTRGHTAGDTALRHVAALVAENARSGDLVARYGGEEFAIVLESDRETAALVGERVRSALAESPIALPDGSAIRLTLSAGVAAWVLGEAAEEVLAKADIGLAMAKRAGRNTVVEVG